MRATTYRMASKVAYATLWTILIAAGILALACMAASLCGCGTTVEGLRFAPGEEQRQAAQAARDAASGGALVGIPPGSDAARLLAGSAAPAASYMGPPRKPIDVTAALVTAGEQWRLMQDKLNALRIRERISQETAAACKTVLAEIVAAIAEAKRSVRPADVLPMVQAVAKMEEIGRKVQAAVVVPESQLSDEEREASGRLAAAVESINTVASMLSQRPVTLGDVGDRAVGAVTDAADKAATWLDQVTGNPTVASLLTALGLGGLGGGLVLRSRSKRRQQEDAAYDAELAAAKARADALAQASATGPSQNALMTALLAALGVGTVAEPPAVTRTEPASSPEPLAPAGGPA